MKRIYISGHMTGRPQLNFPAFNAEAARLRDLGYEVVNPAEINPDQGADWNTCLRADLLQLLTCDTLALLPGWHASAGAHLETHVAHRVGIRVVDAPAITLKREEFLHAHSGMPDVRFVEAEPTTAEQDAWHAGLAAGRDIERNNAGAAPAHQHRGALSFEGGTLHMERDGSARVVIDEKDFKLEDDRSYGPDSHQGSVHWVERIAASEVSALRDFLTGHARPTDDALWDQTLRERDEYHDIADKLANAIADHLLVSIGEHSSANCPWVRALEAIENAGNALDLLTPELESILGMICFQCIPFAKALRAAGRKIDSRAESEQATVIHWMLGHYMRHGDIWREHAYAEMKAWQDAPLEETSNG